MIPTNEMQKRWRMWFLDHPVFRLSEDEIRKLTNDQKEKYVAEWEKFFRNENTQDATEFLINVRRIPILNVDFTLWMMDRLKEAMKQYAEGQWFSSIALCGALVEFTAKSLLQVSIANSRIPNNVVTSDKLSKILKSLRDNHVISDFEFELLDWIREFRDKHLHLKMLSQAKEELRRGNLEVIEKLLNYLMNGESWKQVMT